MLEIVNEKEYVFPDNLVFFDIETTGLDARTSYVFLIGAMRMKNGKCYLIQYLCEDFNEEKILIKTFLDSVSDTDLLIHYNGTTFDIPYLNKKSVRHALKRSIDPENTIDIYKILMHYRRFFDTENMKLKTVEKVSGYKRTDVFEGADLIDLYTELTGQLRLAAFSKKEDALNKVKALETVILLHNSDDLCGLYSLFKNTNIYKEKLKLLSYSLYTDPSELSFIINAPLLPCIFEFSEGYAYVNNGKSKCEIVIKLYDSTLKYFLPDYQNYTYIPEKNICMPTSITGGIEKNSKKKCTRETAFISKNSLFLPVPVSMTDFLNERNIKIFKENYKSKLLFVEFVESIVNDTCFMNTYLEEIIISL